MDGSKSDGERNPAELLQPLMTYREVGEVLGVTDRTVWELVRRGELKNVRVGRSVRVDPTDLRNYIEASKPGTSSIR